MNGYGQKNVLFKLMDRLSYPTSRDTIASKNGTVDKDRTMP